MTTRSWILTGMGSASSLTAASCAALTSGGAHTTCSEGSPSHPHSPWHWDSLSGSASLFIELQAAYTDLNYVPLRQDVWNHFGVLSNMYHMMMAACKLIHLLNTSSVNVFTYRPPSFLPVLTTIKSEKGTSSKWKMFALQRTPSKKMKKMIRQREKIFYESCIG